MSIGIQNLPAAYAWLAKEGAPKILVEALKTFGVHEDTGPGSDPVILQWAKDLGLSWYHSDDTPWCGLAMSYWVHQAGYAPPKEALRALSWAQWGNPVSAPMLGDILTFMRVGGGHVGMYVGEDAICYHVLGGNQDDQVMIERKPKASLHVARRSPWKIGQPANVRVVKLGRTGAPVSVSES